MGTQWRAPIRHLFAALSLPSVTKWNYLPITSVQQKNKAPVIFWLT